MEYELSTTASSKRKSATMVEVNSNRGSKHLDQDAIALQRIGKKSVLKRNFGLISMTGFASGVMCTWEGVLTNFFLGYQNGGPGGLIYGFVFSWVGLLSVFMTIGELSSMFPTAGGQYHWIGVLSPPSYRKFLSYITGWLTASGWIAGFAITAFVVSGMIQNMAAMTHLDYSPTNWQGTLIYWGVILAAVLINTVLSNALPFFEILILVLHLLGFVAIIIPLIYLAPQNTAGEVFGTFVNRGGWYSAAFAACIGLNGNAAAFVGTDGAVHMSEEVKNANANVARSMVISIMINGGLGLGMLLAVLFCKVDIDSVADDAYPFIAILAQGMQSVTAAIVMTALVAILQFGANVAFLAASSRMIWSFARDRGLPHWQALSRVDSRTIPLNALLVTVVISALLGLINIGSSAAFDDLVSLLLEALFLSYLLALGLLLQCRLTGKVRHAGRLQYIQSQDPDIHFWGPWHIPGVLGTINNAFACVYLVIVCFFAFWPTALPVTAENMNYSTLVTGSVVLFSSVYYLVRARKTYDGPIVETDTAER